jgi:large subunit ribosomal protein L23
MSIFNKLKKKKDEIQPNIDVMQTNVESPRSSASSQHKSASLLVKQNWITEKATDLANIGKYIFIVDKKANKPRIKKAIETIYKVKVVSVNMVNTKGKSRRLGRAMGKTSGFKKAIVTLRKGDKIDVVPT